MVPPIMDNEEGSSGFSSSEEMQPIVGEQQENKPPAAGAARKKVLRSSLKKSSSAAADHKAKNSKGTAVTSGSGSKLPRGLPFHLPFKGGSNAGGGGNNSKKAALAESRDAEDAEDDPVVALFKARTTQRVRFSLEGGSAPASSSSSNEPQQKKHYEKVGSDTAMEKAGAAFGAEPAAGGSGAGSGAALTNKSLKSFMKRTLFGRKLKDGEAEDSEEFDAEVAKELETAKNMKDPEMVWESAAQQANATDAASVVCTTTTASRNKKNATTATMKGSAAKAPLSSSLYAVSFKEDKDIRAQVIKLLNKATRAQHVHFRYEYAVKCCMRALELLKKATYPDDHPTVTKTLQSLNNAHHALSSYQNSANIVKMGIRYEDAGEFVRALKMYTIAYRIRRDNLSSSHPSLAVLLNMLGSIQVKRDELEEAMEIYELALKDDPVMNDGEDNESLIPPEEQSPNRNKQQQHPHTNLLARSVAYREMGTIYERWGEVEEALKMYHRSLDCVAEYKGIPLNTNYQSSGSKPAPVCQSSKEQKSGDSNPDSPSSVTDEDILLDLESVHLSRSFAKHTAVVKANNNEDDEDESGGMELFIGSRSNASKSSKSKKSSSGHTVIVTSSCYDAFFPPTLDERSGKSSNINSSSSKNEKKSNGKVSSPSRRGLKGGGSKDKEPPPPAPPAQKTDYADVDIALTLHQIGQLHRAQGEFNLALAAYTVALRGMKHALGQNHPNVAAILGNIGNLQKEMGDMTAAFETYQQVLAIESYRLGLSHPDVAITLHNIATIDAARGNHDHALMLYRQVTQLQRKLFGDEHISLSVTAACMGDVYERVGNIEKAIECFEEALRIKTASMGRHSLEVARILHKLGKLSVLNGDYHLAESYLSRTVLVYRLNKLPDDDEWLVDANRDVADIDAVIAMGRPGGNMFEC